MSWVDSFVILYLDESGWFTIQNFPNWPNSVSKGETLFPCHSHDFILSTSKSNLPCLLQSLLSSDSSFLDQEILLRLDIYLRTRRKSRKIIGIFLSLSKNNFTKSNSMAENAISCDDEDEQTVEKELEKGSVGGFLNFLLYFCCFSLATP